VIFENKQCKICIHNEVCSKKSALIKYLDMLECDVLYRITNPAVSAKVIIECKYFKPANDPVPCDAFEYMIPKTDIFEAVNGQ